MARGRALPDGVAAGDVIRQLWGRNEPAARAAVLRFAREAPLTYGHWSHWKWLYKQAEAAGDADLLATMMPRIDAATPAEPGAFSWLEQTPRAATLAYLKRRARRALCLLAARDAASYVDLAGQILLAAGQEPGQGQTALDPMYNWVSFDILYGGSGRYIQAGHGRGRYVARRARCASCCGRGDGPRSSSSRGASPSTSPCASTTAATRTRSACGAAGVC